MKRAFSGVLLASVFCFQACTVPAWVNTVESDAEIAAPIAASLIGVIDPALSPLVTQIDNGFSALAKTLDTYKALPTSTNLQAVEAAFEAVNANVAQLESAAQIKNAATQTTVTSVVDLLAQAVTEIGALVPAAPGAAPQIASLQVQIPSSGSRVAKGWKAKDFKKQYNKIIKGDPRFKPLK